MIHCCACAVHVGDADTCRGVDVDRRLTDSSSKSRDQSRGYFASVLVDTTGYGTSRCPWVVVVPRGQRVNLTLYNFLDSWATESASERSGFVGGGSEDLKSYGSMRTDVCLEVG